MLHRSALLLGFFAVFLQIAVYLQALLPARYQVSPICETISHVLIMDKQSAHDHMMTMPMHHHQTMSDHDHMMDMHTSHSDKHDFSHQCQYCTVHANLVLPTEFGIHEIISLIHVRWLWFKAKLTGLYFYLQRLFLLPQGRAPPYFA